MPKLSDIDVYQRLIDASDALGEDTGETVRGDTALKAARRALTLLQMALVKAMDDASRPADEPPSPPA